MNKRQLLKAGVPKWAAPIAQRNLSQAGRQGLRGKEITRILKDVVARPKENLKDPCFGELAEALCDGSKKTLGHEAYTPRKDKAPYRRWGDEIDEASIQQMERACELPVAVRGALMPDAHVGYGLPIGGVLAVEDAVIPYAVGVDIACRMKMTVLDMPVDSLEKRKDILTNALLRETCFGVGAKFRKRREHPVLDEDWSFSPVTRKMRGRAWEQLGTSGSGNHFVEYGILTVFNGEAGLEPGDYLALLSHSGSRGTGNAIASHYSHLARDLRPGLPKELSHLAWLDLDSEPGGEYWEAMNLMGRYAAANHELIHRLIAKNLGADVALDIENHHNFAWEEEHEGRRLIVHRKGATPAAKGTLGIIPGSMTDPAFIVRGLGEPSSLNSAAHGAGRRMSRKAAKSSFTRKDLRNKLKRHGVDLISAGLDEIPMAYKDINSVMAAQGDLVEPMARFLPKLVRMAPGGERPED